MMHEQPPQFKYNFHEGPVSTAPDLFLKKVEAAAQDDVLELNCQLFASAVTRARGFALPDYYRSSEHFEDPEAYFKDVDLPKRGDIVGFSKSETTDSKRIHLAVVKDAKAGDIQLIHASRESGTVEETALNEVLQRKNHEKLRFIKRPTVVFEAPNPTILWKLGF